VISPYHLGNNIKPSIELIFIPPHHLGNNIKYSTELFEEKPTVSPYHFKKKENLTTSL